MAGTTNRSRRGRWPWLEVGRYGGWGPVASIIAVGVIFVLVITKTTVHVFDWTFDFGGGPTRWVALILMAFIVVRLAAAWASKTLMRVVVFLSLVAAVAGVMHLGREATVADANRDSKRWCGEIHAAVVAENKIRRSMSNQTSLAPTALLEPEVCLLFTRSTGSTTSTTVTPSTTTVARTNTPDEAARRRREIAVELLAIRETILASVTQRVAVAAQQAAAPPGGITTSGTPTTTTTPTDPKIDDAKADLITARADLKAAPDPPVDIDARQLAVNGSDHMLERILTPIAGSQDDFSLELGAIGWIILAVLAVLGTRRLEIRNNRRYGAPVAVKQIKSGKAEEEALLVERLRGRIGMTELIEPSSVPGGAAWDEASTSLKDSELPSSKWIAAALNSIKAIAFPPAGITASGSIVQIDEERTGASATTSATFTVKTAAVEAPVASAAVPAAQPATGEESTAAHRKTLTVTLTTTIDGRFVRSVRFEGVEQRILDQAGDFIAADVLAFSVLTPPWARAWGTNGRALATYRAYNDSQEVTEDELRAALADAPANGYLRSLLASDRNLAGDAMTAFALHLENRVEFPGFLQARVRFIASASMLAEPSALSEHWWAADQAQRDAIVEQLDAARLLDGSPWFRWRRVRKLPGRLACRVALRRGGPLADGDERTTAEIFTTIAWRDARRLRWRLWPPALLWSALWSQGQRSQWIKIVFNHDTRMRWRDQIIVMRRVLEARAINHAESSTGEGERRKLADKVGKKLWRAGTPAPALYNGACFFSLLAEQSSDTQREGFLTEATIFLERSLHESPVPLVPVKWLQTDPDLERIRCTEQFRRIVKDLEAATSKEKA